MKQLIINLIAFLMISIGSLYLINTSQAKASVNTVALSDCSATFGADCECDPGQDCEAGLFKCKCTGGGDEELEQD